MPRRFIIGASVILVAVAVAVGYLGKGRPTEPELTPEQAREALLELHSLRVLTGREDDPIAVDLRSGAIARTNDSEVTIGRLFSCNLKEKTWRMAVSNPSRHFYAGANGRFEFQSDGTWRAIQITKYIT